MNFVALPPPASIAWQSIISATILASYVECHCWAASTATQQQFAQPANNPTISIQLTTPVALALSYKDANYAPPLLFASLASTDTTSAQGPALFALLT